jgi:energy-coupling factor transporter ATP-binding protein EcfA2
MKISLTRVEVPNFKILKNIDLRFDNQIAPATFAITGANGCGKSLLLQLIFCLLTCSYNPRLHRFLINVLDLQETEISEWGTISQIQVSLDGVLLDLHFCAIRYADLTEIERARVCNSVSFERYQIESIPNGICPLLYVEEEYLLVCSFGWTKPLAIGEAPIDAQAFAQIFNEIARNVFIAHRGSLIPQMLYNQSQTKFQYDLAVDKLWLDLPQFLNLDRELDWWDTPRDPNLSTLELTRLQEFLEGNQGLDGSIVLLDGIDTGCDSANQFRVVGDFELVSAANQYLVATNSFEVCQSLPATHVYGI